MMKADDFGSYHANIKLVKAGLFPLRSDSVREADVSRWLTECEKSGLIFFYTIESKPYLRIINFGQRLRNMRNKFPSPENDSPQVAASCSEQPLETKRNESETNPKRIELEGNKKFSIGKVSIDVLPSEWFKTNYAGFLEQWCMKNGGRAAADVIFEKMDAEYYAYTFSDHNHVQRTFISLQKKTMPQKASESKTEVLMSNFLKNQM